MIFCFVSGLLRPFNCRTPFKLVKTSGWITVYLWLTEILDSLTHDTLCYGFVKNGKHDGGESRSTEEFDV